MTATAAPTFAVFRLLDWYWYVRGIGSVQWGQAGDVPLPRDYDGDGCADLAVYRDGAWFRRGLANSNWTFTDWGVAGDIRVPADYDGDRRVDMAVWRPSTGYWWIHHVGSVLWGREGDLT